MSRFHSCNAVKGERVVYNKQNLQSCKNNITERSIISFKRLIYTALPASRLVYSLSIPGSMSAAWKMMINEDAPTNQKNVPSGDDHHNRGMPMTKRVMYKDFCVIVVSPNCICAGA